MTPGTKSWKSLGRGKEEQERGVEERRREGREVEVVRVRRDMGGSCGSGIWGQALGPVSAAPPVEF